MAADRAGAHFDVTRGCGDPVTPIVALTDSAIDREAVVRSVTGDQRGAVVAFEGAVRSPNGGRDVVHLEYEAFGEMAQREMERIARIVTERWPGSRAAIVHRVGRVGVGETAVVLAVAAPHRAEAFEACRFAIDTLKRSVPLWKKEVWSDGSEWVAPAGVDAIGEDSEDHNAS
ncbi:MAG: molybdenum cofactor biosynthesis protein MoaE [Anaerolineae bacterium]